MGIRGAIHDQPRTGEIVVAQALVKIRGPNGCRHVGGWCRIEQNGYPTGFAAVQRRDRSLAEQRAVAERALAIFEADPASDERMLDIAFVLAVLTAPPPIILDKVKTPTPPIILDKVKTPTVPATALPTGVIRGEVKPDGTLAVISSTSGEANNPAS